MNPMKMHVSMFYFALCITNKTLICIQISNNKSVPKYSQHRKIGEPNNVCEQYNQSTETRYSKYATVTYA